MTLFLPKHQTRDSASFNINEITSLALSEGFIVTDLLLHTFKNSFTGFCKCSDFRFMIDFDSKIPIIEPFSTTGKAGKLVAINSSIAI